MILGKYGESMKAMFRQDLRPLFLPDLRHIRCGEGGTVRLLLESKLNIQTVSCVPIIMEYNSGENEE